ncbi:MAG: GldG family protein [Candidatus Micrarchaeota archaeon]
METREFQRKLLLGGGSVVGILIFLAIVVAVQYIALQHPFRWDLTQTGKFTLASQSSQVLLTFKEKKIPVDVLAFFETKDFGPRSRVRDLLDQYRDVYSGFSYELIDPDKELAIAKKHGVETYPTLVIKAGDKEERITTADEETLTNALVKLLRTDVKSVYFLKGHGELSPKETGSEGFSIAKEQIEKQNYKTDEIVLLQAPSVPEDATILIIAGPEIDPLDTELEAIRAFLKRGGKLLVTLRPFKTPKLAAFLKDYGFETADDMVVDRMSRALGGDYLMPVITTYVEFPITKNFKYASFFPEARSVAVTKKPVPHVDATDLALTSPLSWTINEEQLKCGDANFDPNKGQKGPISVMAVSTYTNVEGLTEGSKDSKKEAPTEAGSESAKKDQPVAEGKSEETKSKVPSKARIVAFGSAQFAGNKFFRLQGNGDLFMNTVSWLAEEESLIAIRPKSERAQPIVLTARQSWAFLLIPVVLMPLAWFVVGGIVYFSRKRIIAA